MTARTLYYLDGKPNQVVAPDSNKNVRSLLLLFRTKSTHLQGQLSMTLGDISLRNMVLL